MVWDDGGYYGTPSHYGYPRPEYGPRYDRSGYDYPPQGHAGEAYGHRGGSWDPRLDFDYQPPMPGWSPQRDWGGYEFASAQGRGLRRGLYDEVAGRVGGFYDDYRSDGSFARGSHRLIYGDRDIMRASSLELGAAAAYEAFLIWDRATHSGRGWGQGTRGLEGLIGLATGEAWNLAADVGADRDPRREERIMRTAAATARALYTDQWDRVEEEWADPRLFEPAYYGSVSSRTLDLAPPRSRRGGRGSFSSDYGPGGSSLIRRRSFDDSLYGDGTSFHSGALTAPG